jgi:hypothetical protein
MGLGTHERSVYWRHGLLGGQDGGPSTRLQADESDGMWTPRVAV